MVIVVYVSKTVGHNFFPQATGAVIAMLACGPNGPGFKFHQIMYENVVVNVI